MESIKEFGNKDIPRGHENQQESQERISRQWRKQLKAAQDDALPDSFFESLIKSMLRRTAALPCIVRHAYKVLNVGFRSRKSEEA